MALDATDSVHFVHYADPRDSPGGIKSLHPHEVRRFQSITNRNIGRTTWQVGAVRAAINKDYDAYIFTGDASFVSTWIAAFIARCRNARVYFWTIGWTRPDKGLKRVTRLAFYRLANKLLVYSPRGKRLGSEAGYPANRIAVIYNSVTPVTSPGPSKATTRDSTVWTLGAVARLTPVKEFPLLIEAADIIQRSGQAVRVIFAGEGPERAKLQSRADSLQVDCQFFGELYDDDEISAVYNDLMVTVVPAVSGLTAIQSLAYGVPVVTNDAFETQAPEVSAIVEGVTGSLYNKADITELVKSITFWATKMSQDRVAVSAACHAELSARWTFDAQAQFMLEAISEAPE